MVENELAKKQIGGLSEEKIDLAGVLPLQARNGFNNALKATDMAETIGAQNGLLNKEGQVPDGGELNAFLHAYQTALNKE